MSLNNIKMPSQLLAGLYTDSLVETTLEEITPEETTQKETTLETVSIDATTVKNPQTKTSLQIQEEASLPVQEDPVRKEESMVEEKLPVEELVKEQPIVEEQPLKEEQRRFDFMGSNKKQILILVAHDKSIYLPDHELKFLISVLKACGLTAEDVAILNLKNQPSDHEKLYNFFQYRIILLFGQEPQSIDLPMNFPQFQLQSFNKCTYLHAPTLSEIEKAKELKMKLWSCLKNLFGL